MKRKNKSNKNKKKKNKKKNKKKKNEKKKMKKKNEKKKMKKKKKKKENSLSSLIIRRFILWSNSDRTPSVRWNYFSTFLCNVKIL